MRAFSTTHTAEVKTSVKVDLNTGEMVEQTVAVSEELPSADKSAENISYTCKL